MSKKKEKKNKDVNNTNLHETNITFENVRIVEKKETKDILPEDRICLHCGGKGGYIWTLKDGRNICGDCGKEYFTQKQLETNKVKSMEEMNLNEPEDDIGE